MNPQSELSAMADLAAPAPRPTVKLIGVGNAGLAILGALNPQEFAAAELVAINTDGTGLAASPASVKIHLENKLLRGLGSGGDPDRGRALAEEQFSTLKSACEGAGTVFILAGLGGGAGSGISPVLAKAAREAGALVIAFVTLPFECEGNRREAQARQSLEHLKAAADAVVCLPNQRVFRLIDENTSLLETFRFTGGLLVEGVRGVWHLITRPGLIQVHFSDLQAVLRDRHAEGAFAFVEAAGAARSREVVEALSAHPLLDDGKVLAEAGAVLLCITAGKDLTMTEINRVMDQVKRQCNHAEIIMGAAVDPALKDKLCVTLIAARSGPSAVAPAGAKLPGESRASGHGPGLHDPAAAAARPGRKARNKPVQTQLPLTIVSKGRFDKSEPTKHNGEDLDVPTFLRRGIQLN